MIVTKQLGRRAATSFGLTFNSNSTVSGEKDDVITTSRRRYTTNTSNDQSTPEDAALKPFSEIPGPKGLPVIGTLWDYIKKDGFKFTKIFEVLQIRSNEFGPIIKETIGNSTVVTITDLDEYAKVIKVDGNYPHRNELGPLVHYQNKRKIGYGLLNSQGEEWHKYRKVLIRKMLPLPEVQKYVNAHDGVASDFVTRLRHLQSTSRDSVVQDLEHEVFKWAFESIACVIFEERIGCFRDPVPEQAKEFLYHVDKYFKNMYTLLMGPPLYKLYPAKNWKAFEHHADQVYGIGRTYVNKKLAAMQKQSTQGLNVGEEDEKSTFLTYLLSQPDLQLHEVISSTVDLLNGGVETTSRGMLWTLYCLAKNPDVQEMVFRETEKVLPDRSSVTTDSLQLLQIIKACVKEAFRLYPVSFSTSRLIAKDIECFGYHIPAGTNCGYNLYAIGRDDRFFPDAKRYQPERWLRGEKSESRMKTFSSLVFGHGARMCIGRRIAEQEIYIVLTKIIQNFRMEYHGEDVEPLMFMALTADRPMKITFIPRD